MTELNLIIAQLPRETNDVQLNVMRAVKTISNLGYQTEGGASPTLVVFPELWMTQKILKLEDFIELTMPFLFFAMENRIWISTGAHYVKTKDNTVKSMSTILTPSGEHIIVSEKHFPSSPMGERGFLSEGSILDVFRLGDFKAGVIICVDAMYPELARILALKGADIILNPSSIPENRKPLWKSIAKTRAAENTVYWASILLTGARYPDGRFVKGGSIVADPSGTIIYESGPRMEAVRVHIGKEAIEKQRRRWPYLNDVREKKFLKNLMEKVGSARPLQSR